MVDTDEEASARSAGSDKRTTRCTIAGQQAPKPAPCSSAHTTVPESEPTGTAMANPAAPMAMHTAPPLITH